MASLSLLVLGAAAGCGRPALSDDGKVMDIDADSAIVRGAAMDATTAPDGRSYQFRAVCLEAEMHDGRVAVLSKWMEEQQPARELGQYHGEFKWKGHRWMLERRVKP